MANRMVFEKFDSLDAFARSLERPENGVFAGHTLSSRKVGGGSWSGTETYEEAMDLLNNGWTEKAEEIRKAFLEFERVHERTVSYEKHRPTTSVIGFTPHVPNAIMGLPNSMIYTERTPMKTKVVRIVYDPNMNASIKSEDIMKAGLAVLKIAYSLERKGLRVRIDVTPYSGNRGNEDACAFVCVKDWRQPIDIKKVAFPIAHTAMFRRLGFRWLEVTPNLTERAFEGTYGGDIAKGEKKKEVFVGCKAMEQDDYFVDVYIAKGCKFDIEEIAKKVGIKSL